MPAPRPIRPVRAKAESGFDLERLLGGRWYAVAGAIILVIGIGLGFKWAYDNGYLRISPAWRCISGVLLGLALILGGEFLRKRINAWAAFGAYAAGLGTVFTSVYVAYRLFNLLHPGIAFAALACVAALGVGVAWRSRLAAVGAVSLVAGYIVPLLFADVDGHPAVLPCYLLTLMAIGLVLAGWLGGTFVFLRTLAWFGTVILGSVWALRQNAPTAWYSLGFVAATYAAFQGELVWSALRRGLISTPPPLPASFSSAAVRWSAWRPLTSSVSTTVWSVALASVVLRTLSYPEWMAPAAAMVLSAMAGHMLAGNLTILRDVPETDSQRLGASHLVQAMGLLLVAVALGLQGNIEVVCWLVLGVGAAATGLWLRARAFCVYALVAMIIATARLATYDAWQPALRANPALIVGLEISTWTLLMFLGAAAWGATSALIGALNRAQQRVGAFWVFVSHACMTLGCVLLLMGLLSREVDVTSLFFAWLLLTSGLIAAARSHTPLVAGALAALLLTLVAWLVAFPAWEWPDRPGAPLAYPGLWGGLAWAAVSIAARSWLALALGHGRLALLLSALVMGFTSTSLETSRVATNLASDPAVRGAALSIWWGLLGFGAIVFGFSKRITSARNVGLALLGVASLKAVILDLASVPAIWRVASFIGLGLLLIAVTVVYQRFAAVLDARNAPPAPPEPPNPDTPPEQPA
ncbi:MAG: DUF2339 domain-containing protein [Leptolyngbya sp. PLA1]|nr:DUF2339 domain-containing protein [Leptolyngbya sp. PLA1]